MSKSFSGFVRGLLFIALLVGSLVSCSNRRPVADPVADPVGKPDGTVAPEDKPELALVAWSGQFADGWKEYDRLVDEQKFEAASKLVEDMLAGAREKKNSEEWVRCLIRTVQIRTGLHGYETSVRFMREQAWPDDLLGATSLNLYYAASLALYAQTYSWEINQREKVDTKGVVDLKAWTREQIYTEAHKAYSQVWQYREQLGALKNKDLSAYMAANSYPREIRASLRDAVTYLWVDLLSNTAGWSAQQTNEVYRLDLAALLDKPSAEPVALDDPKVHPLLKIASLLDDLERWHQAAGKQEAAFEARLERLRRLHQHFTQKAARLKITDNLKQRLPGIKSQAWWSMGMATLAEFTQAEDTPDNLIRARRIAMDGAKPFPDSIGGQRCRHIIASIEAPAYNLEGMATDGPERRSVGLKHKNLDAMYFRAYRLDLLRQIESADDYSLLPSQRKIEKLLASQRPSQQWKVDLKRPADFKMHTKYVTPPMVKSGLYAVIASAREDFSHSDNVITGIHLIVTDLVLVTNLEMGRLIAHVYSGQTGRSISGAEIRLYRHDWQHGHKVVETKTTDAAGEARFAEQSGHSHFLFARKGDQQTLDGNYLYLYRHNQPGETRASLIYTDRSIYRPTQTMHFKVIAYRGQADKADFKTWPNARLTVNLVDPNNQNVASLQLTTNSYGTASGEFVVPTGRLLGQWRITSSLSGQAMVKVEEYKRPTFEAKFLDPEQALRLNRKASLKGEARYYFGLPVTSGTVRWKVVRSPVYPWWWGYYWNYQGGSAGAQTVASGTSKLDAEGKFSLDFTPEADESGGDANRSISYRYAVEADVVDEGGETRQASKSFRLGFVAVEARVETERGFFLAKQKAAMTVVRTDLNGTAAPGQGSWRVVALNGPAQALLPADQPRLSLKGAEAGQEYNSADDALPARWSHGYRPEAVLRGWADGPLKGQGALEHDKEGKATVTLPGLPAGAYRLHYETKDAFGSEYTMSKEFIVGGPRTDVPLPAWLLVEKTSLAPGQTARVLVFSGLRDQPLYLEIYRKRKLAERRLLNPSKEPNLIEIPIQESDRGGFGLGLTAIRDHQYMRFSQSIFVPWDNKELKLEFATFRDTLRPGTRETWTVKVTSPKGKPVEGAAAELLAYMYDRSLDTFVGHTPPSPLSLFPNWSSPSHWRTNLGQAQRIWLRHNGFRSPPGYPSLVADRLMFFDNYGIGGVGRRNRNRYRSKSMALRGAAPPPAPSAQPMSPREDSDEEAEALAEDDRKSDESPKRLEGKKKEAKASSDAPAGGEAQEAGGQVELRTNFSETAFWQPHLLTDADGTVRIEFEVPDSVTSWNVWLHAISRDLSSASLKKEARTVKELMVRPYLPRFLREGDRATLKVVVNNASERTLAGKLSFDIIDPLTEKSLLAEFGLDAADAQRSFSVEAGGGSNLSFAVRSPARVGQVAFRVTAVSGDMSDGELRPLPLLPGRMHLIQSRFAVLKDKVRRELHFDDMAKDDDASLIHDQLVVTLDGQLFYSVLSALPYLVNYPYECTEQTLNRFLSTGILSSMYKDYPAIARMAEKFSKRDTRLERWDADDPNRKMALEETPWLQEAQGGRKDDLPLINVLDPRIAKAQRNASLAKLQKAQTSAGAFPWFPGGPPSPWITLYILHGFSKALEFGVDVPKPMVQKAWRYMHRHYINEIMRNMMEHDCCWESITFLNYVLSNYPDASWTGGVFSETERNTMLDFSFKHWKQHSPYLKGYLALTLTRRDRAKDARLVWESVMDSAKMTEDQGTFWAPEDRAWLWYNDTIETHAFAVRTVMELTPDDPKLDGLVLWLFLNKKLNHWKSTRATAEVIYSLAHYLKKTGQLGLEEKTTVTVGDLKKTYIFKPDEYSGKKNQIVVPGDQIDPKKHATVVFEKETRGYQLASATWHFSTERLPKEASGDYLGVTRKYFKRIKAGDEVTLKPLADGAKLEPGDEVEVQLSLTSKHPMEYVHLRDPRPAGFEPSSQVSRHRWNLGIYWYEEVRDSGMNFFFERLPQGEFPFKYRIRAAIAGTFKAFPATVQPMYAPEFAGYSSGREITIDPSE